MPMIRPCRAAALAVAAAALLSACSTVDLGPRYESPPVRQPQPLAPLPEANGAAMPYGAAAVAQASAVPSAQPQVQALPPGGQAAATSQGHLVTLSTQLGGAAAVPPTPSRGTGQIDLVYNTNTRLLRWKTQWSGLSAPITAVQFHAPAYEGQTAPPTLIWPAPFGATYEGRATLSPEQARDLVEGRWYVNVQTRAYPAGEVRGQLRVVR